MRRVIIIHYNGEEAPKVVIDRVIRQLSSFANGNNIEVVSFDQKDIDNALVSVSKDITGSAKKVKTIETYNKCEAALIYIGQLYKEDISSGNMTVFANHLYADAAGLTGADNTTELQNAIEIVACGGITARASVLKEYGISNKVINAIRAVGNILVIN